jgi:hypothetical protein
MTENPFFSRGGRFPGADQALSRGHQRKPRGILIGNFQITLVPSGPNPRVA